MTIQLFQPLFVRLPSRLATYLTTSSHCLRICLLALCLAQVCSSWLTAQTAWQPSDAARHAAAEVTDHSIRSHLRFLADDLLEGRGPATRGDALTQLYIQTQLESLGLQPGAGEDRWLQPVPMLGVSTSPPTSVQFQSPDESLTLNHHTDMMLVSGQPVSETLEVSGELVFVGYGIQAPEYDWDDFKDVDLTGKVLVFMNNDPEDDPELFGGRKRLYYGRWDYKYAQAARVGAAAALIIHSDASAGYPYQVVQTSWAGEEFNLEADDGPRTLANGWLTEDACRRLMNLAGLDLGDLREQAQSRDFRPVPLGVSTRFSLTASTRRQVTGNVLGILPGSDPELNDEYLVFTAHHDHLGLAAERDERGDNIFNGAVDNASGTAALLAIAKAVTRLPQPPRRSILFAFVGAEEQGLLGSKHLAQHPPMQAGAMAAAINIDGINFLGRTHDITVVGNGKSDLDALVEQVAQWQGRTVLPDNFPDRGYYYRSDQFSLAQIGVPGVFLDSGLSYVGRPDGWGKQQVNDWLKQKYHQRSDEYDDSWNLEGAVQDAQLMLHVGLLIADQEELPQWTPGDEFEAARQRALAERDALSASP